MSERPTSDFLFRQDYLYLTGVAKGDILVISDNKGNKYKFEILYPANDMGRRNAPIGTLTFGGKISEIMGTEPIPGVLFVGGVDENWKILERSAIELGMRAVFVLPTDGHEIMTLPISNISLMKPDQHV